MSISLDYRKHSAFHLSSMDERPRPTSGCPSVRRSLDVYEEPEAPSTQHRRLYLLRSSKTGEGERKFIFNLVIPRRYRLGTRINITAPASGQGVITESS